MSATISIVYFTRVLPSPLADELASRGVNCLEALALSEVFNLCEQPEIDLVVIDPSVDYERVKAVQDKFPTLRITAGTNVQDVLWEITNLLGKTFLIQ